MNGYEFYCTYHAVKLHFNTDSYDFFKYNGKTNATHVTFGKRKDKHMFHRLARNIPDCDVLNFLVANFLANKECWTKDLLSPEADTIFQKWKGTNESLQYTFKSDMQKVLDRGDIDYMLSSKIHGEYPKIFVMLNQNEINVETIVILDILVNIITDWDKVYKDDFHYSRVSDLIKKYKPFLKIDKKIYSNIVAEILLDSKRQQDYNKKLSNEVAKLTSPAAPPPPRNNDIERMIERANASAAIDKLLLTPITKLEPPKYTSISSPNGSTLDKIAAEYHKIAASEFEWEAARAAIKTAEIAREAELSRLFRYEYIEAAKILPPSYELTLNRTADAWRMINIDTTI
jgi:hypothetical protein